MVLLIETVFMLVLDAFTWPIFALLGWPWMNVLAFFLELFHVVLEGKIAHVSPGCVLRGIINSSLCLS